MDIGQRVAEQQRELLDRRLRREGNVGERATRLDRGAPLDAPLDLQADPLAHAALQERTLTEEVSALVVIELVEIQDGILDQPTRHAMAQLTRLSLRRRRVGVRLLAQVIYRSRLDRRERVPQNERKPLAIDGEQGLVLAGGEAGEASSGSVHRG